MPWRNCCAPPAVEAARSSLDPTMLVAMIAAGLVPITAGAAALVRRVRRAR